MPKIAFILITYNGEVYIEKCIRSIRDVFQNAYVIVLDNNSSDGTRKLLSDMNPDECILLEENLGFGKANNIGIRLALKANCDSVFLVNQDTYFLGEDVQPFLNASKQSFKNGFGIVSPIHLAPNESDFDRKFSEYISERNAPGLLTSINHQRELDRVYRAKSVNAAAWYMSRECIEKVGVFDPIFPHYGEDTDYIKRMRYHKMKIGVIPNLRIVHNRDQSITTDTKRHYRATAIWAITYVKDINRSMVTQYFKLPTETFKRFRRRGAGCFGALSKALRIKWLIYSKLGVIRKHRKISKATGAFISI
ncbi:glycosyltransferase family 2 protein [Aureitalea sp. L0-47]|uniref:glycosyltransferase family 2 protein n=1 Tax=Aureitalea sp. L0-47 TaxID=2816962 RepID=UPI002237557F|nr:glycosyltransferase family 2 protein [Aureitalea sp. L0-47]